MKLKNVSGYWMVAEAHEVASGTKVLVSWPRFDAFLKGNEDAILKPNEYVAAVEVSQAGVYVTIDTHE